MNNIHEQLLSYVGKDTRINSNLKELMIDFIHEKKSYTFPFYQNCIEMYRAFSSEKNSKIHLIGLAIEYLILALDIVDDIQDRDSNYKWSEDPAQALNGVLGILLTSTYILRSCDLKYSEMACNIFECLVFRSIEGQIQDLKSEFIETSEYIEMVRLKSGSLSALSFIVGYVLATGKINSEIIRLGEIIGITEQISNDIEGFTSISSKNDLYNKKVSLPILYMVSKENELSEYILSYYRNDNSSSDDIDRLKMIAKELEPVRFSIAQRILYRNRGRELVNGFKFPNNLQQYLLGILK
ncbi:polyprenyl synthetase family protein [Lysinibacillus sp. 54212]|uniref:polyprenyl synthetase family protein n=1 Tax=Lysinibacillus sp. 54212 TaxID=3119829 RepID=UPI002FC93911